MSHGISMTCGIQKKYPSMSELSGACTKDPTYFHDTQFLQLQLILHNILIQCQMIALHWIELLMCICILLRYLLGGKMKTCST